MPPSSTSSIISVMIEEFLMAKIAERRSVRTIQTYRQRLERFRDWMLDSSTGQKPLTRGTMRAYLANLQADPQLQPISVAGYFRDVATWLNWIVMETEERAEAGAEPLPITLQRNPARNMTPKVGKYMPASYSVTQLRALLAVCDVRDRALLLVLLDTGVRARELCSMQRDQLDFASGDFVVLGKGEKERRGRLSELALDAIRAYLATRSDADPALWYGRWGPLTPSGVHQLVDRRARQAGIRSEVRRLIHALRATFAKHLRKRGADLATIADLLGHAELDMARHYSQLADEEVLDLKEQINPLGAVLDGE